MSEVESLPTIVGIEDEKFATVFAVGDVRSGQIDGACHGRPHDEVDEWMDEWLAEQDHNTTEGEALIADSMSRMIIQPSKVPGALEPLGIIAAGEFLSNGARLYMDDGGYPEYCTAEHASLDAAVRASLDGDRILSKMYAHMLEHGVIGSWQLNRRLTDHMSKKNNWAKGVHDNIFTSLGSLTTGQTRFAQLVQASIATITGSGGLMIDKRGETQFYHSPRLSMIGDGGHNRDISRFGQQAKPLRAEFRSGDALSFPWAMKARLAMEVAAVRLMEEELVSHQTQLIYHLGDSSKFNRNAHIIGLHGPYANAIDLYVTGSEESQRGSALSLLGHLITQMLEIDDQAEVFDDETVATLTEIVDVVDMAKEDVESVADIVESVARQQVMTARMRRRGEKTLHTEAGCKDDFLWDVVGPYDGIAMVLRDEKGIGWHTMKPDTVRERRRRLPTAPSDTRAALRSQHILDGHSVDGWNFDGDHRFPTLDQSEILEI